MPAKRRFIIVRAGFVGSGNLYDVTFASGSPFYMRRALERYFEPAVVIEEPWPRWFLSAKGCATSATGGRFHADWSPRLTALAGARTVTRLRAARPDVVFALLASPIAHLLVDDVCVVHVSDTTLRNMLGYNDDFSRFSAWTRTGGEIIETKTIRNSFLQLFPSEWARRSAIRDYGASPDRALEIAWGANLDDVRAAPRTLPGNELRLLFTGVSWIGKGGQIAVDTAADLTRRGLACRLDIVGCSASAMKGPVPPNVTFHGFVSKTTKSGVEFLHRLYREATIFMLPTRFECFGIALAEAAHYGLPAISTATGGIPSLVRDGVTGVLLPPGAPASAFADAAMELASSPERYEAMSRAALAEAASRLNWETWAEKVHEAVAERLSGGADSSRFSP